jgi:hypothetical protein
VLTDMDLGYALSLGLVFWVGQKIMDMYRGFGIDLAQFQGNGGWFLPIPATLVVGRDGRVKARFVDPDFACGPRTSWKRCAKPPRVEQKAAIGFARQGEQAGQRPRRLKFSYRPPSLRL